MAIADNSSSTGGNGFTASGKKRIYWAAIRAEYENGTIGLRKLARAHGISPSTMMQRSMREKWQRNDKLVRKTSKELALAIDKRAQAKLEASLAPFIEAEKAKFTRAGVALAKTGLRRVKRMMAHTHAEPEAKSEAFISKSAETYHRIGRVALGMGDGSPVGGSVSLNILTNAAAVQVVSNENKESDSQQ